MAVSPGTRLGPYEIRAPLGAGGMGEVYRARDSRLRRDVAIKVLPAAFSADVDRLHRFEQEARAAAALNHPNILAVYDVGTDADAPFIVSELLEGETLRERLKTGVLPLRKAIDSAVQIARGLAAAHERGITHRDLKPENVFITTDNRVKILDFGLAKLTQDQTAPVVASALATSPASTQPGIVLGTVGYMAPEQVRGVAVDHRADLFAFGAILYEVLSGARAFRRDTAPETMAAILNEDPPDLRSAGRSVPPALARIVDRCLEKNPSARFQTASDLAFALEALSDASDSAGAVGLVPRTARRVREPIAWAVAALLLLTLAPLAYRHVVERPPAPAPMRFQVAPAVELARPGNFAVSPDGSQLAFFGVGADGIARLYLRSMDTLNVRPLPGSEIPAGVPSPPPFWSPDGKFVAFQGGDTKLKKLNVSGGPAQTLCELPGVAVGGSWNREGDIIVGNTAGGLLRVRENGGDASPVTGLDPSRKEEFHLLPSFLPDGHHFVYLRISPGAPEKSGTYVGTLDAKPGEPGASRLMPYVVGLAYVSSDSGPGRLLFLQEGTLMAQPFDPKRLALAGRAVPVAERVGSFRDGAYFSASTNDVLVYRNADTDFQLAWFDRQGTVTGRASEPGGFRAVALALDGARAVVSRTNPQDPARADLWLIDLSRDRWATRFTFGGGMSDSPVWSPDGKRVVFTLNNTFLHQKSVNGEDDEKELLRTGNVDLVTATGWSPDGRSLLYSAWNRNTMRDIWVLSSDSRTPVPFLQTRFTEDQGRFSSNGRWVAYVSDQSGAEEVYVRAFASDFGGGSASTGGSVLVSQGGGTAPRWRGDGTELFYLSSDGKMMAVDVKASQAFSAGAPGPLFQTPTGTIMGDVTADGKRFLLATPVGPSASAPFTVVLNWTAGLKG